MHVITQSWLSKNQVDETQYDDNKNHNGVQNLGMKVNMLPLSVCDQAGAIRYIKARHSLWHALIACQFLIITASAKETGKMTYHNKQ